jgi:hypothetical protein
MLSHEFFLIKYNEWPNDIISENLRNRIDQERSKISVSSLLTLDAVNESRNDMVFIDMGYIYHQTLTVNC